ncbi:MAG: hypothetical protein ACI83I_001675 [Bacteroidia bacterium]|jgi:hypothetical protein
MNKAFLIISAIVALNLLIFNAFNAESYSGDPPEVLYSVVQNGNLSTCNSCHGKGKTGSIPETGGLEIDLDGKTKYEANKTYNVTVRVEKTNKRHGFQMIALDKNLKSIGTFIEESPNLKIQTDAINNVSHISHNNVPFSNDGVFRFQWKAPDNYTDEIKMYAIAVSANGNGNENGDSVYFVT